jgi:hypothetical protein
MPEASGRRCSGGTVLGRFRIGSNYVNRTISTDTAAAGCNAT